MKNIILCLLNVLLMVTGQIIFKYGMKDKVIDSVPAIIKAVLTPVILSGLVVYAFTTFLWLYILSKIPISYAYPIQALAFPIVLIMSYFIFKEVIPITRWIGIIVIFIGVFFVVR